MRKSIESGSQPTLLKFFGPDYLSLRLVSRPVVDSSPLDCQIGRSRGAVAAAAAIVVDQQAQARAAPR